MSYHLFSSNFSWMLKKTAHRVEGICYLVLTSNNFCSSPLIPPFIVLMNHNDTNKIIFALLRNCSHNILFSNHAQRYNAKLRKSSLISEKQRILLNFITDTIRTYIRNLTETTQFWSIHIKATHRTENTKKEIMQLILIFHIQRSLGTRCMSYRCN